MQSDEDVVKNYKEIFGGERSKILKDSQVLSPDYLPPQLIGRKNEITDLARIFKPLDSKGYPSNALVLGYPGSGKTVVTKFLLSKLMERLENEKILDHPLRWVYISCKIKPTPNGILYEIIKQIDPETKIPMKGFSLDYYYSALWDIIRKCNVSLVIVLDEIDYLKSDGLLYNLSRAGESRLLPNRHFISTIGISNDLHYGKDLDNRVKSSMNFKDHIFDPYNVDQIRMILCDRVKLAFYEGAILEETVNLSAAISARVHGDARKAIELLRASAIYAEEHGFLQVLPEHIDGAFNEVDIDRFLTLAPAMPLHKKLVLLAILKLVNYNRPTTTVKDITNTYFQICEEIGETPRHRTTISNSIGELTMIGMIKEVSIRKGRGASGREIELDVPSGKALEDLLYRDYRLEDVRDLKLIPFLKSR